MELTCKWKISLILLKVQFLFEYKLTLIIWLLVYDIFQITLIFKIFYVYVIYNKSHVNCIILIMYQFLNFRLIRFYKLNLKHLCIYNI